MALSSFLQIESFAGPTCTDVLARGRQAGGAK